jgi:hypothetical protein
MPAPDETTLRVGWREWLALPDLGIAAIKAKIDTGARTSALHAFEVVPLRQGGRELIRFRIHPIQRRTDIACDCTAEVIDRRWVSDSGGHRELRYVICTSIRLGPHAWPIEVTLTDRDPMSFRMLLGRTAMQGRLVVDPETSYQLGKPARPTRIKAGATAKI